MYSLYRRENAMKKFFSSLIEHATNETNFERKKMLPLTKRRGKITPRFNGMSHLCEKILKEVL